jgi:hypothetical protein
LLGYENYLKQHSWSNFIDFSLSQEILQLFYSITMAMSMDGGILIGLARPYILLLETKQSGKYKTYQMNLLVTNDLSNIPF